MTNTKILSLLVLMLAANTAEATLTIMAESAIVSMETQDVLFTLTFSGQPDFFTIDEYERQADAFQYYIFFDNPAFYPGESYTDTLISGGEIYQSGDLIILDVVDGGLGGWGPVLGSVPYILNENTLTFTTSLALIGDDGIFSYKLETYEYGTRTDFVYSHSIPEPATVLLLALGGLMLRKRRG